MDKRNQVQSGQGALQYRVPVNITGFAMAYGRTGEEFTDSCRKLIAEGFVPEEYSVHASDDGPHFVQFFLKRTGEDTQVKAAMVSATEDILLINETKVKVFNEKVKEAFKQEYFLPISEGPVLLRPQARLYGKEFYFTVKMIKAPISLIELANTIIPGPKDTAGKRLLGGPVN
jgi:hypothetical protein